MIFVRFYEGSDPDDRIVHDTKMLVPPQLGENVTFRWPNRQTTRFVVEAVDHLLEPREGHDIVDDLVGVRVRVKEVA